VKTEEDPFGSALRETLKVKRLNPYLNARANLFAERLIEKSSSLDLAKQLVGQINDYPRQNSAYCLLRLFK